jgi:uncharacterized FlaG/YvyC family protein
MDVGSPIRQPAPNTAPVSPQAQMAQKAVATELSKPMAVDAIATAQRVKIDVNPDANRRAAIESSVTERRKQFVIDQNTKDTILRTVDGETGNVIAQFPDDWQIKQRAYSRAMLEQQFAAQQKVDRSGEFVGEIEASA